MRGSRFSIGGVMIVVAIAAIDSQAIRILLGSQDETIVLLLLGTVPMLNVLAIGRLLLRRPGTRRVRAGPFLVGFEAFGGAAMILLILASVHPVARKVIIDWLELALSPIGRARGLSQPITIVVIIGVIIGLLLLPQLLFAVLGGVLSRRYRVVIGRRHPADSRPMVEGGA